MYCRLITKIRGIVNVTWGLFVGILGAILWQFQKACVCILKKKKLWLKSSRRLTGIVNSLELLVVHTIGWEYHWKYLRQRCRTLVWHWNFFYFLLKNDEFSKVRRNSLKCTRDASNPLGWVSLLREVNIVKGGPSSFG